MPYLLPKLLEDTYYFGNIKLPPNLTLMQLIKIQDIMDHGLEVIRNGNYYHLFKLGELERSFFYNEETGDFRIVELAEIRNNFIYAIK